MISILLPFYNDVKHIGECLVSISDQVDNSGSKINFECLIGLNGTNDQSKELLGSIITSEDERFKIFDFGQEGSKVKTLNKLLELASGEYICLIDADDVWRPNKLWSQLEFASKGISDIIGTYALYIDDSSRIMPNAPFISETNKDIQQSMLAGKNHIINSSCFMKKADVNKIGGWREVSGKNNGGLEDMDLWIRFIKNGYSFHNINQFLVYHRIHNKSNFNSRELDITPFHVLSINGLI